MTSLSRVLITPGEPAGIGPDILIKIAQQSWPAELVAVFDPELIKSRAKLLNLPIEISEVDCQSLPTSHAKKTIKIIPVQLKEAVIPGKLNTANAMYVQQCLEIATDLCLQNKAHALVTGPIQKSVMNDAGIPFSGHTEFLAQRCRVSDVIMLFVVEKMKVALVTTHLPLRQVPDAITQDKLTHKIQLLHQELTKHFKIMNPAIFVCGLNPHAGESGHLGQEEIDIIQPVIQALQAKNMNVRGPFSADTIFTEKYLKEADVILAMYHDQALPVVKYLGFSHAVNVTLGLPIIRTSVDHGTALDVAGTLQADERSLAAALQLAIKMGGCTIGL